VPGRAGMPRRFFPLAIPASAFQGMIFWGGEVSGNVIQINKSRRLLADELGKVAAGFQPDVIFWPVAWREAAWRIGAVGSLRVPVVGYFPGGAYSPPTALNAVRRIGVKRALPYLREAVANKKKQVRRLKAGRFERIIAALAEAIERLMQDVSFKNKLAEQARRRFLENFIIVQTTQKTAEWIMECGQEVEIHGYSRGNSWLLCMS